MNLDSVAHRKQQRHIWSNFCTELQAASTGVWSQTSKVITKCHSIENRKSNTMTAIYQAYDVKHSNQILRNCEHPVASGS